LLHTRPVTPKAGGHGASVLFVAGGKRKHYALTNEREFFAEMTEAYFGMNDFAPFNRGELLAQEPEIHALLAAGNGVLHAGKNAAAFKRGKTLAVKEQLELNRPVKALAQGGDALLQLLLGVDDDFCRLNEIDIALGKIQNGTYGVCEKCGVPIEPEILSIDPESRFCNCPDR